MAKTVTTLFIEDTAIRFMMARGRHIEKWASIPLEEGLVKHGLIQDQEKVASKLKELFQWAKIKGRITLGLSEPGSLYRIITLPRVPEAILPEAVNREAERVIPLSQNEIYIAYQVITTTQEEMQVFLVAISRNAVDTLVSTLQAAGARPASLDLVPLALCRATGLGTAIIVSLRCSNFDIAIMIDGIPQVIRSLSLPSEVSSLNEKIHTVAEELDRTITFYNSSHTDKPLDKSIPVYVDGELVHAPETWINLVGSLGSTVTPLPSLMQPLSEFEPDDYLINIGLALKENIQGKGLKINLNALPVAYQPEKTKLSRTILPIGIGAGVILIGYLWILGAMVKSDVTALKAETSSLQSQINLQTKEINSIKDKIKQAQDKLTPLQAEIEKAYADMVSIENMQVRLEKQRNNTDVHLAKIVEIIPDGMVLSSIGGVEEISISGTATSETTIFKYARDLKATGMFRSVILKAISFKGNNLYDFDLYLQP